MPLYQVQAGDRILAADINQFYQILKGVAASGETVTLIYNNQALILQPSSDPTAGTRVVLIKNTAGTVLATWRYDGLIELLSAAAAPASAIAGSLYWDTALSALRINDGTNWRDLSVGLGFYAGESVGRWLWDWDGKATIEATVTGTGAVTLTGAPFAQTQFATGATINSTTSGRQYTASGNVNGVGKVRLLKFHFQYANIDANTNSSVYLTDEDATTNPSATARHLGLRQAGAVINFSTGDNTTEQVTDVSSAFTAGVDAMTDITYDGTTARCYVNGTLKATHATNVPAAATARPTLRIYITNTAAAAKNIYFDKVHAVFAV